MVLATPPITSVEKLGVRYLGWVFANCFGSARYTPIANVPRAAAESSSGGGCGGDEYREHDDPVPGAKDRLADNPEHVAGVFLVAQPDPLFTDTRVGHGSHAGQQVGRQQDEGCGNGRLPRCLVLFSVSSFSDKIVSQPQ